MSVCLLATSLMGLDKCQNRRSPLFCTIYLSGKKTICNQVSANLAGKRKNKRADALNFTQDNNKRQRLITKPIIHNR